MDYEGFFEERLDGLRPEGRYRAFADLERRCGRFCAPTTIAGGPDHLGTLDDFIPEARAAALGIPQPSFREVALITSIGLERQRRDQRRCRERSRGSRAVFRPRPPPLGGSAQWC
jgi:hypothetical protein